MDLLPASSKGLVLLFSALLLILSTVLSARAGVSEKGPAEVITYEAAPVIRFSRESVNMGKVNQGASAKHVFTVYNDGAAPLNILKVEPG